MPDLAPLHQTPAVWVAEGAGERDMRVEAVVNVPRILFLYDSVYGHVTKHLRGLLFQDSFLADGWDVAFIDFSETDRNDLLNKVRAFDAVYLLKVADADFVRMLREQTNLKVIFDLTDALWRDSFKNNGWQGLDTILAHSHAVFCDNEYPAAYGARFCSRVFTIPACTRTEKFEEMQKLYVKMEPNDEVIIGWVGSVGTVIALENIREPLERVFERNPGCRLRIVGCDDHSRLPCFQHVRFSACGGYDENTMMREILDFDIGLFPSPGDLEDFAIRGPLKAALYMSARKPVVVQNAGICPQFIVDGVNGMLASSPEEWEEKLERLVTSFPLRKSMGDAGFVTVCEKHSLANIYAMTKNAFQEVLRSPNETLSACDKESFVRMNMDIEALLVDYGIMLAKASEIDGATYAVQRSRSFFKDSAWQPDLELLTQAEIEFTGKTVVDFGCKYGHTLPLLLHCGAEYGIGLDVEPEYLDIGNQLLRAAVGDRACILPTDEGFIPLQPETVDFVFLNEAISHINPAYLDRVYSEISRILKTGGICLISDGNTWEGEAYKNSFADLYDAWENGEDNTTTDRDTVDRSFRNRREDIIRARYPRMDADAVEFLALNTSLLFGKKLVEVIDAFVQTGELIRRPYRRGLCPTHPLPCGIVMERGFHPVHVCLNLEQWGLKAANLPNIREHLPASLPRRIARDAKRLAKKMFAVQQPLSPPRQFLILAEKVW